jgi:exodeoxyribonuclease VII large subunit
MTSRDERPDGDAAEFPFAGSPADRSADPSADAPLTVSQLSRRILRLLEDEVGEVRVTGEVSGVRIPRSGHCYFMLKDADAAINAVCFRSALARARARPADGMQIELRGRLTAYAARSEYQIVVASMREAGLGDLMRRFLELKEKLKAEGLFEPSRKRPIPAVPRTIGVVTSPTGAALRDVLNVLGRRARGLRIVLSPAAVQGEAAPAEIVAAIERLQRHGRAEVLIVGRGGGSIEDLWAFNDERVVRAIAACPIPVIAAVGHETDTTLSDFAADLRAPTPSAAAELVSAHYGELEQRLGLFKSRLARTVAQSVREIRARLERCRSSWGLRGPVERLGQTAQRVDDLRERLDRAGRFIAQSPRQQLQALHLRLRQAAPVRRLQRLRDQLQRHRALLAAAGPALWRPRLRHAAGLLAQLDRRMATAAATRQRRRQERLEALSARLAALGPEAVLQRGYSIVTHGARARVVRDPASLRTGETVRVRSAGGRWKAAVLPPGDDLFERTD